MTWPRRRTRCRRRSPGCWPRRGRSSTPTTCPGVSTTAKATGYALELAPLFTLGALAAGIVTAGDRIRRLPWCLLTAPAAAPVLLLVAVRGSAWTVRHYFWVDLAAGPAIAMVLAAVATRRPAGLVRLLDSRPLRALGGFSFSLYLIHLPIAALVSRRIVAPHVAPGLPALWVTLVLAVPACLLAARAFAAVVEAPFVGSAGAVGQAAPELARRFIVPARCAAESHAD